MEHHMPQPATQPSPHTALQGRDHVRIARALEYMEAHAESQPGLEELARHAGLSRFHFQRLFTRWAGISPARYLQNLTLLRAKGALRDGAPVLEAALESGLSGPGRLHDLFVAHEAITPGEFRRGGAGLHIGFGLHPSPFGMACLARTERGLCALEFLEDAAPVAARSQAEAILRGRFPGAVLRLAPEQTAPLAARIFDPLAAAPEPLPLVLRGTNFQVRVWRALLELAPGMGITYGALAGQVGQPGAARAVGRAVGANPIAFLIPCHRVIRQSGALGGYHWGVERKARILASEVSWRQAGMTAPPDVAEETDVRRVV